MKKDVIQSLYGITISIALMHCLPALAAHSRKAPSLKDHFSYAEKIAEMEQAIIAKIDNPHKPLSCHYTTIHRMISELLNNFVLPKREERKWGKTKKFYQEETIRAKQQELPIHINMIASNKSISDEKRFEQLINLHKKLQETYNDPATKEWGEQQRSITQYERLLKRIKLNRQLKSLQKPKTVKALNKLIKTQSELSRTYPENTFEFKYHTKKITALKKQKELLLQKIELRKKIQQLDSDPKGYFAQMHPAFGIMLPPTKPAILNQKIKLKEELSYLYKEGSHEKSILQYQIKTLTEKKERLFLKQAYDKLETYDDPTTDQVALCQEKINILTRLININKSNAPFWAQQALKRQNKILTVHITNNKLEHQGFVLSSAQLFDELTQVQRELIRLADIGKQSTKHLINYTQQLQKLADLFDSHPSEEPKHNQERIQRIAALVTRKKNPGFLRFHLQLEKNRARLLSHLSTLEQQDNPPFADIYYKTVSTQYEHLKQFCSPQSELYTYYDTIAGAYKNLIQCHQIEVPFDQQSELIRAKYQALLDLDMAYGCNSLPLCIKKELVLTHKQFTYHAALYALEKQKHSLDKNCYLGALKANYKLLGTTYQKNSEALRDCKNKIEQINKKIMHAATWQAINKNIKAKKHLQSITAFERFQKVATTLKNSYKPSSEKSKKLETIIQTTGTDFAKKRSTDWRKVHTELKKHPHITKTRKQEKYLEKLNRQFA